ncbi:MAG: cytochrome c maturation protein CcmE [Alphaproteobacteria bacterium]
MRPKHRRLAALFASALGLGGATALALLALEDSIVFFYSPGDVATKEIEVGRRIRLGGLVETGSVARGGDGSTLITFRVTDLVRSVPVSYDGILPDLFREGQGVVTEGAFDAQGTFRAQVVLAKHDETYMPPEVAEALKKSGRWREGGGGQ